VRFVDLELSGPPAIAAMRQKKQRPKTGERTGIAINRRRGVAQDDFLFSTELFMPGVALVFSGTVKGAISLEQAALLVAGLRLIPALGRSKSGGLGWIEAEAAVSAGEEVWTATQLARALSPGGIADE
jgi:CRISPR/Cas system CSM-associated protein Csm3 (group 7 of RAMP superfamily)